MDTSRFTSKPAKQRRTPLTRSADGRLRPDSGDHEIGDIWAQQRRIRLAEELAEKRKQAALRKLRRERGLYGLARLYTNKAITRLRTEIFGTESVTKQPTAGTAKKPVPPPASATKTIEIKLAVPKISGSAWQQRLRGLRQFLLAIWGRLSRRVAIAGAGIIVVIILGSIITATKGGDQPSSTATSKLTNQAVAAKPAGLQPGTPDYPTLTPNNQDSSQLGGWKRVSPTGKDPVYAYADKLAGISIAVSQQPLPADFKRDTETKIAELAKSFSANDTLDVDGTPAYIGTSAKGPQSVIFSKNGLLILIKSDGIIKDSDWSGYIASLH